MAPARKRVNIHYTGVSISFVEQLSADVASLLAERASKAARVGHRSLNAYVRSLIDDTTRCECVRYSVCQTLPRSRVGYCVFDRTRSDPFPRARWRMDSEEPLCIRSGSVPPS